MGKIGLFGASLVGAIPAGYLVYLLVQAFLGHSEDMGSPLLTVLGIGLLAAGTVLFLPLLVLIFVPTNPYAAKADRAPKPAKSKKPRGGKKKAAAGAAAPAAGAAAVADDDDGFIDDPFGDDADEDFATDGFEDDDEFDFDEL